MDHLQASRQFRLVDQFIWAAIALFIFFATLILNALFPPALLNPAWIMRLVAGLISNAYLPLLGLVLVHLAAVLHPEAKLNSLRKSLARWAVLASVGFLLLLPLQAWASWRLIQQDFSALDRGKPSPDEPLVAMERAIREAPDAATLQTRLTILRGPAIAPEDLARPLPELKRILLASLREARLNLLRKARSTPDPRGWVLVQDVVRFSVASIGFALGFAAFAQRPGSRRTLLNEWKLAVGFKRVPQLDPEEL